MKFFVAYTSESEKSSTIIKDLLEYLANKNKVFEYRHTFADSNQEHSFDQLIKEIDSSDAFIGEMSFPSQTLGFQLAYALQNSKPSLYLYRSEHKRKPQGLIGSIPTRKLRFKRINEENFKKVVNDFVEFTEKQLLTNRTSFMSTKEIDDFLTSESKKQKLSKGELIRQLLGKSINQ